MKIGGYYIKNISKRFWAVLALGLFVVFLLFFAWPKSPPPGQGWYAGLQTAWSPELFKDSEFTLDTYYAQQGLCQDEEPCVNRPNGGVSSYLVPSEAGKPFRFRAYVPGQNIPVVEAGSEETFATARESLYPKDYSTYGWNFFPAILAEKGSDLSPSDVVLGETETADLSALDAIAAESMVLGGDGALGQGGIQIGIQGTPPESGFYDFDGVLFSTSNALRVPGNPSYQEAPLPTLIVSPNYRKISTKEIISPASAVADIAFLYSLGRFYQFDLRSLEWTNGEARLCLALSNISGKQQDIWEGLEELTLVVDGKTFVGVPQEELENIIESGTIADGATQSGYLAFEDTGTNIIGGNPNEKEIKLQIPSLRSVSPEADQPQIRIFLGGSEEKSILFATTLQEAAEEKVPPLGEGSAASCS